MSVFEELKRLSSAEDFFEVLDVEFDPSIVRVSRLHIMRRMGQYLAENVSADQENDEAVRARFRQHLQRAYDDFCRSSPLQERVFKVHQEAAAPKAAVEKPFVPLETLFVGKKVD